MDSSSSNREQCLRLALALGPGWPLPGQPSAAEAVERHWPARSNYRWWREVRDIEALVARFARVRDRLRAAGGRALLADDEQYPGRLVERLGSRAPRVLFVRGQLPASGRLVGVVGTRAAAIRNVESARALGAALVEQGYGVVSGGALGIDAAAHRGALDRGGCTVAVLGSGLDDLYPPRNRTLFAEIATAGGALVTPFAPGDPLRRGNFPARNRLIAAWSEVVVVIEAGERSGALDTAAHARALGAPLVAYPGSAGCDRLRARGLAHAVDDPAGVCEVLVHGTARPRPPPADPDERTVLAVLRALGPEPVELSRVATRAGIGLARAAAALIRLQLGGHVGAAPGGRWTAVDPRRPATI